jgi:hypothetical protein
MTGRDYLQLVIVISVATPDYYKMMMTPTTADDDNPIEFGDDFCQLPH